MKLAADDITAHAVKDVHIFNVCHVYITFLYVK